LQGILAKANKYQLCPFFRYDIQVISCFPEQYMERGENIYRQPTGAFFIEKETTFNDVQYIQNKIDS